MINLDYESVEGAINMAINSEEQLTQLTFDQELFDAEIKPSYWVNQSTELVNMRQDLNLTERRLIYSLIALVQPDDKDFKTYVVQIKELAELIGITENSFYERVEKAVDGLQSKQLVIERGSGNNKIIDKITWVQRATYIRGEGQIRIKLSEDLAQYLLNLKSYTKYRLMNVLKLKSEYSWRIYELLKEHEWRLQPVVVGDRKWKTSRVFKVDELRKLLNIPEDKYKLMKHFRESVLDKAKKELQDKTDIIFEYEIYKKAGRKIDSFIFYINGNPKNKKEQLDIDSTTTDLQDILHKLVRYGVRRKKAVELIERYDPNYLEANLLYVISEIDLSQADNPAGYIIKAIEENYAEYETLYNADQDDPLYKILISKVDKRLEELSERDIKALSDILTSYDKHFLKFATTTEDIQKIGMQREKALSTKWDEIQRYRETNKFPPLSISEIESKKLKQYLEPILNQSPPF